MKKLILRYHELTIILAHWGDGLPFYALIPPSKVIKQIDAVNMDRKTKDLILHVNAERLL